ncbi:putative catecholamine binding [Fragilaria crotonensis]|nr:putative catecholamine binding [Fragilaria crotonensis]
MVSPCRFSFLPLLLVLLSVADRSITSVGAASSNSTTIVDCSNLRDNPVRLIQGSSDLILHAVINPVDNTLIAELIYAGEAWVSLGFAPGRTTMVGAQAVIGWPNDANSLTNPGKYDMTSESQAGVILMQDSRQTLTNATIEQTSAGTTLSFTKLLVEDNENSILSSGKTWFVWAYGTSNAIGIHANRGGFGLTVNQCLVTEGGVVTNEGSSQNQGEVAIEVSDNNQSLWIAHGVTAAVAWAILVPLAIGSALIRKLLQMTGLPKSLWFDLHRGLNALAAILTIVSFSIAVYIFNKEPDAVHFSEDPHHTVGLLIFIITLLQALNGIFRPHLPHTEEPEIVKADDEAEGHVDDKDNHAVVTPEKSTIRIIWEYGHKFLGVGLFGHELVASSGWYWTLFGTFPRGQ